MDDIIYGDEEDIDIYSIFWSNLDSTNIVNEDDDVECTHEDMISIDGGRVCTLCGVFKCQLDYTFDKNEEGSRCQYKSSLIRSVDDVFRKNTIEYPDIVLDEVDKKYRAIVKYEKVRGKSRDALIAICLLFCFRHKNDNKTLDDMKRLFSVSRKDLSASLSRYYRIFPEDRTKYLHSEDLVKRTLLLLCDPGKDFWKRRSI